METKIISLTSPVFEHGGVIPSRYTCDGLSVNPPLTIDGVPSEAESLVLIMEDPDVPTHLRPDGMWDHWVVFNTPPAIREIAENTHPEGIVGMNTRGNPGYGGPCPSDREHRYFFKLFALDTQLSLSAGSTKVDIERAMEGHVLAHTELMGRYERG